MVLLKKKTGASNVALVEGAYINHGSIFHETASTKGLVMDGGSQFDQILHAIPIDRTFVHEV